MFQDATQEEIDLIMDKAAQAAIAYRQIPLRERRDLMHRIADALTAAAGDLIAKAMSETSLPEQRLSNELNRTIYQLRSYGDAAASALWMDIRIDLPDGKNVHADIRKMQVPLGPVVVFGASNFPFAYSTAGGDTACALAAGCPVIVKGHPAHAATSQKVADVIMQTIDDAKLPEGIFSHVHGASFDVSKWLVMHPHTRAVGFTGSFAGGKQLFDWASQRSRPIPVFSEMGSTNPVFLLPEKLQEDPTELAAQYARSITTNAGQFCTKPGLIVALKGSGLQDFQSALKEEIRKVAPQKMLHNGIAGAYEKKRKNALSQRSVDQLAVTSVSNDIRQGTPVVATVPAAAFADNPVLHEEVFGPYSLIIVCAGPDEMLQVARSLGGQLTATIIGTEAEIAAVPELLQCIQDICGRIVMNGVPTGVSVCWSMQHGGPFPATTDSRFTSVGPDGIRRFTRPLAYQNWPDRLLPDELKADNPLRLWRLTNSRMTREGI